MSEIRQNQTQNSNRNMALMSNRKSNNTEIIAATANIVERDMNILNPAVQRMVKLVVNVAKQTTLNQCANRARKRK